MKYLILGMLILVNACATMPAMEKRHQVIECVVRLKREEFKESNAFTICSRTYGVQETQVSEDAIGTPAPSPSPSK